MTPFTFVHAADLHLDAPFRGVSGLLEASLVNAPSLGGGSAGTGAIAAFLQNATFTALERLTRLCLEVRADALLLAGDIYTSADSSLRARLALRESFLQLEKAGTTVFLVHGNHDPLGKETTAVPWPANVTVFGPELSSRPLRRGGETLALVHGISHSVPDENRNLARLFSRARAEPRSADLFQIGLLHCALTGKSGAHSVYAPCGLGDLAASGLDYWALGHVHDCQVMGQHPGAEGRGEHPFAAYSGSLQGLHINESGPHGCLVVRVDASGRAEPVFAPLAPVQWESLSVRLDREEEDVEDFVALAALLRERLDALAAAVESGRAACGETSRSAPLPAPLSAWRPDLLLVRLHVVGRTALDAALRKTGVLEDLYSHLNKDLAGSGMLLRDIILDTRPPVDEEALLARDDLAGETARIAERLRRDPEALADMAEKALHPLFSRAGIRQNVDFPGAEELADLAEEARLLCQSLLEGE